MLCSANLNKWVTVAPVLLRGKRLKDFTTEFPECIHPTIPEKLPLGNSRATRASKRKLVSQKAKGDDDADCGDTENDPTSSTDAEAGGAGHGQGGGAKKQSRGPELDADDEVHEDTAKNRRARAHTRSPNETITATPAVHPEAVATIPKRVTSAVPPQQAAPSALPFSGPKLPSVMLCLFCFSFQLHHHSF